MENCKRVFKSVRDTILDKELLSDGLWSFNNLNIILE
jgi:hypothetical protein